MKPEVIVLGLGAMGSAALYHLAKRGIRELGIEQFISGKAYGSSHGQTRMIRKAYFEHSDYVPLLNRAYELWSELEEVSGEKLYHETGIIYFLPEDSRVLKGLFESTRKYQ